jgi:hypothetical protein
MRRVLQSLALVAALAVLPVPADAQVSFGVHGAVITSVDDVQAGTEAVELSGTFGLGGRVVVSPPVMPISLVGATEYYFPSCPTGFECSLWTASAGVNLGLPLPIVRPYVHGALQFRGDDNDANELNLAVSIFLEGLFEFVDVPSGAPADLDVRPFVLKGGIVF